MSQKTFANHLADEEAALAQRQQQQPQHQQIGSSVSGSQGSALRPSKSTSDFKRSSTSEPDQRSGTSAGVNLQTGEARSRVLRDPLDEEPLLQVKVPTAPSAEEIEALTSAHPLSYNAARSDPPPPHKPQRQFCEICGYWGTVKCMKCGARTCGLECKGAHDDGRCLKFYA